MNKEDFKTNPKTTYLFQEYTRLEEKIKETEALLLDAEMKTIAETELAELTKTKDELLDQMKKIVNKDTTEKESPKEIIMEIRAGAGGHEAGIFALELMDMYQRYSEKMGWDFIIIDESKNELGGYKEVSVSIKGKEVYDALRYESEVPQCFPIHLLQDQKSITEHFAGK